MNCPGRDKENKARATQAQAGLTALLRNSLQASETMVPRELGELWQVRAADPSHVWLLLAFRAFCVGRPYSQRGHGLSQAGSHRVRVCGLFWGWFFLVFWFFFLILQNSHKYTDSQLCY